MATVHFESGTLCPFCHIELTDETVLHTAIVVQMPHAYHLNCFRVFQRTRDRRSRASASPPIDVGVSLDTRLDIETHYRKMTDMEMFTVPGELSCTSLHVLHDDNARVLALQQLMKRVLKGEDTFPNVKKLNKMHITAEHWVHCKKVEWGVLPEQFPWQALIDMGFTVKHMKEMRPTTAEFAEIPNQHVQEFQLTWGDLPDDFSMPELCATDWECSTLARELDANAKQLANIGIGCYDLSDVTLMQLEGETRCKTYLSFSHALLTAEDTEEDDTVTRPRLSERLDLFRIKTGDGILPGLRTFWERVHEQIIQKEIGWTLAECNAVFPEMKFILGDYVELQNTLENLFKQFSVQTSKRKTKDVKRTKELGTVACTPAAGKSKTRAKTKSQEDEDNATATDMETRKRTETMKATARKIGKPKAIAVARKKKPVLPPHRLSKW